MQINKDKKIYQIWKNNINNKKKLLIDKQFLSRIRGQKFSSSNYSIKKGTLLNKIENEKISINLKENRKEKQSKLIKYKINQQIKRFQHNYFFILLFLVFLKTIFSLPEELPDQLPKFFDLREKYNQCQSLLKIRNQGNCGCCWASATTSVINDKICINSNGKSQEYISETDLITCCENCFNQSDIEKGCGGGNEREAFKYWINNGLPSEGTYNHKKPCKPFIFDKEKANTTNLECQSNCIDDSTPKIIKGSDIKFINNSENAEIEIMKEIYINGSVTASFFTYKDFGNYWNKNCSNNLKGIYNHTEEGEKTGAHTIKIIGWGNEIINGEEVPYWICVNSWGKKHCNGVFKFIRGINNCGIESCITTTYIDSQVLISTKKSIIAFENNFFSFKKLKNKDFR